MTGTTGFGDDRASTAARPSRLRRIGAACFLGAGAYACISLGTQAAAHAVEPPLPPLQSATGTADPLAPDAAHDPATAPSSTQPPPTPAITPATSTPVTPPSTGQDATTTPPAGKAQDPAEPPKAAVPAEAGTGGQALTQTDTSAGAQTPSTEPAISPTATATVVEAGVGTEAAATSACAGEASGLPAACGVPVFGSVPTVAPASACLVPDPADPTCGGSSGTVSTGTDSTGTVSTGTAAHETVSNGRSTVAHTRARPADDLARRTSIVPAQPHVAAAAPDTGSPAPGLPVAPPQPLAPATAVTGLAGCGSTSAGPDDARGPSAGTAAGLGGYSELSLAVTHAARTAPAEGSPVTGANDPSARPD